ncbi:MAG: hypothetical protein KAJ19_17395, partial [Gammaproteobacteria bacterium]|nr:hypothetical protein [Gammaproteobacteria bacterium]
MSFTTNWSEVTSQLSIFLSDEGTGDEIEYSQQQRIDAWNWSQRALVSHTPRQRECSPVVNAGGRSAELPEDFYEISRVYCEDDSQWLRPMRTPQPGERRS